MPSSVLHHFAPSTPDATGAEALAQPSAGRFHVVPFRRTRDGAIVPGAAIEVTNGDIAWRAARAAAFDHDNVGAVAFSGTDLMLTRFGEVNLDALQH